MQVTIAQPMVHVHALGGKVFGASQEYVCIWSLDSGEILISDPYL